MVFNLHICNDVVLNLWIQTKNILASSIVLIQVAHSDNPQTYIKKGSKLNLYANLIENCIAFYVWKCQENMYNMQKYMYISRTANTWRNLPKTNIWQIKNVLASGRLACTSSKPWNLKWYRNLDFSLEFSIQFKIGFHQQNLKIDPWFNILCQKVRSVYNS